MPAANSLLYLTLFLLFFVFCLMSILDIYIRSHYILAQRAYACQANWRYGAGKT
ncbi:MAG: hypothetical protein QG553_312 [Patescibacteria group bacterium]|nr:hypothetical protein [Patescibacteria group bacterium]